MDIEPRLLRYFLMVVEELHFGRAAAKLYVSQPALSESIKRLESTLGVELLVRTNKRVELTPAGKVLQVQAPEIHRASAGDRSRRGPPISSWIFTISGSEPHFGDAKSVPI